MSKFLNDLSKFVDTQPFDIIHAAEIYDGGEPEVLHRIVSMASECVDTGPHSGALVTLMAVCGLTHRESYYDVVMLTLLKTLVVFLCLAVYMLTGIS